MNSVGSIHDNLSFLLCWKNCSKSATYRSQADTNT